MVLFFILIWRKCCECESEVSSSVNEGSGLTSWARRSGHEAGSSYRCPSNVTTNWSATSRAWSNGDTGSRKDRDRLKGIWFKTLLDRSTNFGLWKSWKSHFSESFFFLLLELTSYVSRNFFKIIIHWFHPNPLISFRMSFLTDFLLFYSILSTKSHKLWALVEMSRSQNLFSCQGEDFLQIFVSGKWKPNSMVKAHNVSKLLRMKPSLKSLAYA